ncbi:MAG: hypothetical protein D3924_19750, partial [Candidatus Electrothrix sp. AR4]|nr:hypothetical protein [Candidatus Electrothrix sp. AR4]
NDGSSASYYGVLKGSPIEGKNSGLAFYPPYSTAAGFLSGAGALDGIGYARNRGPHEFSHNLNRPHAVDDALPLTSSGKRQGHCGSTAKFTFSGHTPFEELDYYGRILPVLGPLSSGPDSEVWGLDNRFVLNNINDLAVISPWRTFALMSYCAGPGSQGRWISEYTYNAVMGSFPVGAFGGTSGDTSGDVLFIRGTINQASGDIEFRPVVQTNAYLPAPTPGSFRAALFDENGNELAGVDFTPISVTSDADVEVAGSLAPPEKDLIMLSLPKPAIPIEEMKLTKDGTTVASVEASPHVPTVSILSPAGGETYSGNTVFLKWMGSDLDGDLLTYTVFYSIDGGTNWELLVTDLTEAKLIIPKSHLTGSNSARFQVQVSDGLNSISPEAWLIVPRMNKTSPLVSPEVP